MGLVGSMLSQSIAGVLSFDYGPYMMIGMMVIMLFMTVSMGMLTLVDESTADFMQEIMVSPISRYSIVIGKIIGASFGSILCSLGALIVGLFMGITISSDGLLRFLALSPLMCLSGGAMAIFIIGLMKSKGAANIMVMVITIPQMFLCGAFIPISNSSGILLVLSRLMPMTYCLDLARAVVYAGTPEYNSVILFNPFVTFIAIVVLTVLCLIIGTIFFARSETHK
jgi:ABC-2 type transport system permease protein